MAVATTARRAVAAVARRGAVPEEGEALAAALRDGPDENGPRQRGGRRAVTEGTSAAAATRVAPRESEREEDTGRRPAPEATASRTRCRRRPPVRDTTDGARGRARETDVRAGPAAGTAVVRDVSVPSAPPLPKELRGSPRPALQDGGELDRRL